MKDPMSPNPTDDERIDAAREYFKPEQGVHYKPMAEFSFWTRSAILFHQCRRRCCGYSKLARLSRCRQLRSGRSSKKLRIRSSRRGMS